MVKYFIAIGTAIQCFLVKPQLKYGKIRLIILGHIAQQYVALRLSNHNGCIVGALAIR